MEKEKNTEKIYYDSKFIGKIIKNARKRAGLTQAELAEMLGVSDKSIGGIENGHQFPLVKNFLHIIETLNLTLSDFGISDKIETDKTKEKLFKKIYSSSQNTAKKYLKALEFIDEIL